MCYGEISYFENIYIYTMLLCITATKPRFDILFRVLLFMLYAVEKESSESDYTFFFYIFIWNSQKTKRNEKNNWKRVREKKRGEHTHAVCCVCEAKKAISRKDLSFWGLFLPSFRSLSIYNILGYSRRFIFI